MDEDVLAKLVTIERLLMIVLADGRYAELLVDAREEVHRDYGERLNGLFPSDPEYGPLSAIVRNFNYVADMIAIDQEHELLK